MFIFIIIYNRYILIQLWINRPVPHFFHFPTSDPPPEPFFFFFSGLFSRSVATQEAIFCQLGLSCEGAIQ